MAEPIKLTQAQALFAVLAGGFKRNPLYWRVSSMNSYLFPVNIDDRFNSIINFDIECLKGVPVIETDYINVITDIDISLESALKNILHNDLFISSVDVSVTLKDVLNKTYQSEHVHTDISVSIFNYDGVKTLADDGFISTTSIQVTST